MNELENVLKDLREKMYPDHDFVPTCGGRGQHHLRGVVGHVFEVLDASKVRSGSYDDLDLRDGDVLHCLRHAGDGFQEFEIINFDREVEPPRKSERKVFGAYESYNVLKDLGEL